MSDGAAARLFVALELPAGVVEALIAWQVPLLREGGDALRPVAPEALHVTLCFLGWQPEAAIAPLGELVEGCAGPRAGAGGLGSASGLALGEPLWLPRRRPRVLAIAVDDRHGELGTLQQGLVERLVTDGWYDPETRPYLPHVTVARVRGESRSLAGTTLPAAPELVFDGVALTLYRSRLDSAGARYERLSRSVLA
jgi:RNA 2',3'-cyclic 3'-phosphodiesterase